MLPNQTSQSPCVIDDPAPRNDWRVDEIQSYFSLPFIDLVFRAQTVHRENFDPNEVQLSTLLNIKTGGCPEDCSYCPQSAHYDTEIKAEVLLPKAEVICAAKEAKKNGATRFCMGGAWRSPRERDLKQVLELVAAVKELGLETCATLGMLTIDQAQQLKQAGLDFYNHNIDTSAEFYPNIISTRTYQERLDTLENVRNAGLSVCCGGILGLGETVIDRINMLRTLANLPRPPESVPINMLVRVEGTPLAAAQEIDPLEIVRTIAVARILMPKSYIRLSAGRSNMPDSLQALCFMSGANSVFYGEKLLTTENPQTEKDMQLFQALGIRAKH